MTAETGGDPRLESTSVETVAGDADTGDVTLVGVVHDHPSSIYRVRSVVADRDPDVLGLELPPLSIPLYEAHAADERPESLGGEMSAAVQAAATDEVVGIDGPTVEFLRYLAATLSREEASPRTVWRSLRELGSVSKTTLLCRLAATVTANTSLRVGVGAGTAYEATSADPPERQASDERRQIREANAVLDAFEPSAVSRCRSAARERYMADRLSTLRERGDVVAVVGVGHLDAVRAHLEAAASDDVTGPRESRAE